MTEKTIKVGDRVLWYGYDLVVKEVGEVVKVHDEEASKKREEAREKLHVLRQKEMTKDVQEQIGNLNKIALSAVVSAGLRRDLLSYWPERGVWVSDGRILTEAQVKEWQQLNKGQRPAPEAQRKVLDLLSPAKKKEN